MPPLILLAIIAFVPLILLTILRVKPLYAFVSIVTGYFWVEFLGEPAELTLRSFVHVNHPDVFASLALLLIPFTLTLYIMKKTLSSNALPFQFFLLVADSLLLMTFLLPLLPPGVQGAIYETHAGTILRQAHDVMIAGIVGLHVLVMWIMRPRSHNKHKKKH